MVELVRLRLTLTLAPELQRRCTADNMNLVVLPAEAFA